MTRFPRSVYGQGDEPDARFSLANERTFLAWVRTSLALLAGGVALEVLGLDLHPALRLAASLLLVVAGGLTPVFAWFGWAATERALRAGTPLPSSPLALGLVVVIGCDAVLVLLSVVLR